MEDVDHVQHCAQQIKFRLGETDLLDDLLPFRADGPQPNELAQGEVWLQ